MRQYLLKVTANYKVERFLRHRVFALLQLSFRGSESQTRINVLRYDGKLNVYPRPRYQVFHHDKSKVPYMLFSENMFYIHGPHRRPKYPCAVLGISGYAMHIVRVIVVYNVYRLRKKHTPEPNTGTEFDVILVIKYFSLVVRFDIILFL